ncbi:MAG: XRE family transcriptional regulator [Bacteroidota bacterium]
MRQHIGERIKNAREAGGLLQAELARKLQVTPRTIQRWERGEQIPDADKILKIAHLTHAQSQWLLTGEGSMYVPEQRSVDRHAEVNLHRVGLVKVPLLASVPGGRPALIFHPDFVERYVVIDDVKDPSAIGLIVRGQSMAPRLEEGDIIIVSPKREARSGDICVIRVGDEDTVKRIKFEGHFIHLIPLNRDFEPMVVHKKDVSFIWKVVRVIKEL